MHGPVGFCIAQEIIEETLHCAGYMLASAVQKYLRQTTQRCPSLDPAARFLFSKFHTFCFWFSSSVVQTNSACSDPRQFFQCTLEQSVLASSTFLSTSRSSVQADWTSFPRCQRSAALVHLGNMCRSKGSAVCDRRYHNLQSVEELSLHFISLFLSEGQVSRCNYLFFTTM